MSNLENAGTVIYCIWLMTHLLFQKLKLFCGYCSFPLFINRLAVFKAMPNELSQRAE